MKIKKAESGSMPGVTYNPIAFYARNPRGAIGSSHECVCSVTQKVYKQDKHPHGKLSWWEKMYAWRYGSCIDARAASRKDVRLVRARYDVDNDLWATSMHLDLEDALGMKKD